MARLTSRSNDSRASYSNVGFNLLELLIEEVTGHSAPQGGPRGTVLIALRPELDRDAAKQKPPAEGLIRDHQRGIFDIDGHAEALTASFKERRHVPPPRGVAAGMDHRPAKPDRTDRGLTRGEFRQAGPAAEVNLLDGQQRLPRTAGRGERDTPNDDALPFHEAGGPHPDNQSRKAGLQPVLDPLPNLLADAMRPQRDRHDHRRDRQRQRPANERPEGVGEGLHASVRWRYGELAAAGTRRRRPFCFAGARR